MYIAQTTQYRKSGRVTGHNKFIRKLETHLKALAAGGRRHRHAPVVRALHHRRHLLGALRGGAAEQQLGDTKGKAIRKGRVVG